MCAYPWCEPLQCQRRHKDYGMVGMDSKEEEIAIYVSKAWNAENESLTLLLTQYGLRRIKSLFVKPFDETEQLLLERRYHV